MQKIKNLNLDIDSLQRQLRKIEEKLKGAFDNEETQGFWQSLKDLWNKFVDWILDLFA